MKRLNNKTFFKIINIDNLILAHQNASSGKQHYSEVKWVNNNLMKSLLDLQKLLYKGEFTTSEYNKQERIEGGKLREIYVLPYYPDRIVQHAIIQVIGDRLTSAYIRDTFQSIKGRGTGDAVKRVSSYIRKNHPTHYLQIDIKKYYPNIKNNILKKILLRFIKCIRTLNLLFDIIDSCIGVPIGNYTSQFFGNIFLTPLDWYIKQHLKVKGYFRYCDDLVFMGNNSVDLHIIKEIVDYKLKEIGLSIKPDWKIHKLTKGLDFVGYVFYPKGYKLRKSVYTKAKDNLRDPCNKDSLPSYYGWLKRTKHNKLKEDYENTMFRAKT